MSAGRNFLGQNYLTAMMEICAQLDAGEIKDKRIAELEAELRALKDKKAKKK